MGEVKGLLLDVDGTILDSMGIWENLGVLYLESLGYIPEKDLSSVLYPMTLEEAAGYIKEHYSLRKSVQEIIQDVLEIVRQFYYEEAPLKEGVKEYLSVMKDRKIPMMIVSSGEKSLITHAFERLGILDWFEEILTCTEIGKGKEYPDIYFAAAECLGQEPADLWVFEDAYHAAETAKKAGFYVIGVYDSFSALYWGQLEKTADQCVYDMRELLNSTYK